MEAVTVNLKTTLNMQGTGVGTI